MSKAPQVDLSPDLAADAAAGALALPLLDTIEANLPGTLADEDSERLHDFRVGVRRTRSLQRELRKTFPKNELRHFRREFRWLQQVTGPTRDLDVYLLEFGDFLEVLPSEHQPSLEVIRHVLEGRRAAERAQMEAALRSARTANALRDWRDLVGRLSSAPVGDRPAAARPIGDVAARRIECVYREMVEMGSAIDDDSPHSALHDLRKKGKELRYLLEFFSSLFPREVTKPMVKTLKRLQDVLGRFQDREVQGEMIGDLRAEVDVAEARAAMDLLIEQLHEQQALARAEFSERFGAFASPEQRALVDRTFRPG